MSLPTLRLTLRLRLAGAVSAAVGLVAVMAAVGALFPAVGHTIGTLHVPHSVLNLLGGADYGTVAGWFRSEIAVIYGPLVIGALAITGATATTAGEEEAGILALVLTHPIARSRLVLEKAAAVGCVVVVVALGTWVGLIVGVALAGGGITLGHMAALAVSLACFGLSTGALALALAAATGRRGLATQVASGLAILGWLINSFAPLVSSLSWLRYLSPFYWYAGHDPLTRGLDVGGLVVLGALTAVLLAVAAVTIDRRDLRG